MKRFLLIGTVFFTAALFGLGIALFLPANAGASECHLYELQYYYDCEDSDCPPELPVGQYLCGTEHGGSNDGGPCLCEFIRCQLRCPNPLP